MGKHLHEKIMGTSVARTIISALSAAGLWLLAIPTVHAASNATSAFQQVIGTTVTSATIITDIKNVAMGLFAIIAAAAAGFGIVFIALGGISLIHGGGVKKQEGMEKIRNGVIGIVVALGAGTIVALAAWIGGMFTS